MSGHAACQRRWRDACLNMSCPSSHGVLGFLLLSSRSHPQRIAWTLRETLQSVPLSLVKPSHQALNPFATLLWSMSRPQTLLNPLSPVQLIRHAPITKASSNYVGMSMWMPFLWHLSHQCVCSKSGSTCATLQVMLSTGNPCLCFCGRPAPPPKKKKTSVQHFFLAPPFINKSIPNHCYFSLHKHSGEPELFGLFGSELKKNFNNKQSTHTILWSEYKNRR